MLQLLGGDYSDEDTEKNNKSNTIKDKTTASNNTKTSENNKNNNTPSSDPTIDTQLDTFLQELEQITGESMQSNNNNNNNTPSNNNNTCPWQACLDAESKDYYYWNTITDQVCELLFFKYISKYFIYLISKYLYLIGDVGYATRICTISETTTKTTTRKQKRS